METTYFVVDSSVSDFYPYNKPSNFIVWLGKTEHFRGTWRIGLSEIIIDGAPALARPVFVTCSLAVQSFALRLYERFLRRVTLSRANSRQVFSPVNYYMLDNTREFSSIQIRLIDANTLNEVDLTGAKVTCVLHLTR